VAVVVVLHLIHHQSADLGAAEAAAVQQIKRLATLALQILAAVAAAEEVLTPAALTK
jgi:hypothetical protein